MNVLARSLAALTLALLAACSSSDSTAGASDDGGATTDGAATGAATTCTEADLARCDYPERALSVSERVGVEVRDAKTGRTLPLVARIPEGAGPFPVFVWSHGGGFNQAGNRTSDTWGTAIASQGFVVLHASHVPLTAEAGRAICALAAIPAGECKVDASDEDGPIVAVVKALDLIAVLDGLEEISKASVARGGPALDRARVAVGGWSAGSRGPTVLLGAKLRTTASAPLFARPDTRVVAAFGLSTAGPGFGGYFDDGGGVTSWSAMRGPFLLMTGANDVKPLKPGLTGEVRRFPFSAQPGDGSRHMLYSNLPAGVGGHETYNLDDRSSDDERLVRLSRALRSTALAFLDAYVRGDEAAKAWLATGNGKVLAGDADWATR